MVMRELFVQTTNAISEFNCENPAFEAALLISHFAGLPSSQVITGSQEISPELKIFVKNAIKQLEAGKPLPYIMGSWEFYSLDFYVGDGVLIPRPETEFVVDAAVEYALGIENPVIADLCSGSGCIAIACAYEIPDAKIYAVEKSTDALEFLKRNIKLHEHEIGGRVIPVHGDIFGYTDLPAANIIVSNPPYIRSAEIHNSYEPYIALDGGADGLLFYRAIAGLSIVRSRVRIIFETGYDQAEAVAGILESNGFINIRAIKDYSGHDRIITAIKM